MTLSLNIGNFFNDSSSHALVDELRKRTSEEDILDFEEKFNSKNEKNLHVYICRFLKNRSISRGLASRWLITIIENKESKIDALQKLNNFPIFKLNVIKNLCLYLRSSHKLYF